MLWRVHHGFHHGFEKFRDGTPGFLASALRPPRAGGGLLRRAVRGLRGAVPVHRRRISFPQVDAGQIRLHVRAASGARIEETEQKFAQVEKTIREIIPPSELSDILDDIGLPTSGNNLAFGDSVTLGTFDGEMLVSLQARASIAPPGITCANCAGACRS